MSDTAYEPSPETKEPKPSTAPAGSAPRDVVPEVKRDLTLGEVNVPADVDRLQLPEIERLDDKRLAYSFLHDVFKQSWHLMKEQLAEPSGGTEEQRKARQALARKLWNYRQWHFPLVLEAAGADANKASAGAYERYVNKGSDALTSDVDLMLQGKATELVVGRFNKFFRAGLGADGAAGQSWDYEPGIVYDVNAYEQGYVTNPDAAMDRKDGARVPFRQGARGKRDEGGISDPDLLETDRNRQTEASLVKLRLYMTGLEWTAYVDSMRAASQDAAATAEKGLQRFEIHFNTLAGKMKPGATFAAIKPEDVETKTGMQLLEELARGKPAAGGEKKEAESKDAPPPDAKAVAEDPAKAANVLMSASNRAAEELLEKEVLPARLALEDLIARQRKLGVTEGAAFEELEKDINATLVRLRDVASRVQAFANEAYLTDAGLHHAVVGMQAEQRIQLTKSEGLHVVIENIGDALKELARYHEHPDEALYKAAKYMLRLADAAKSMGYGYIGAVQILYDLGRAAAAEIKDEKKSPDAPGETKASRTREYAQSQRPFRNLLGAARAALGGPAGPAGVELYRKAVIDAGTDVQKEYQLERQWIFPEDEGARLAEHVRQRSRQTAETLGRPTLQKADFATSEAAAQHTRQEPLAPDAPHGAHVGERKETKGA